MLLLQVRRVNRRAQRRAQIGVADVAGDAHDGGIVLDVVASALGDLAADGVLRGAEESLARTPH